MTGTKGGFYMKTKKMTWLALLALILTLAFPSAALSGKAAGTTYRVTVSSGYLALRNDTAYDASNEIGKLYTGDTVELCDMTTSAYWFVYSSKLDKYGYVNKDYLTAVSSTPIVSSGDYTVSVSSGYLALRNAKAFDASNEIGKLYSGDTVQVQDTSDSTYWYVYASRLKKSGYVNRRYLANSSSERYVSVKSGYLALRNAKAFKSSNEVAELYTGDKVQIADASDSTYWLVYVPGLGKGGYVNKDYLVKNKDNTASAVVTKTVKVKSGYLALRNAKAYDDANEIGQLNNGDTVQVQDSSGSTYWYVYSSRLGKSGYVNKNYLQ